MHEKRAASGVCALASAASLAALRATGPDPCGRALDDRWGEAAKREARRAKAKALREARREQTARAAPARHAKKLIMEMGPPDQWHKEEIEAAKARAAALKSAEAKRESDAASARARAAQQRAELAAKAAERSGHAPLVKWT